ncbi:uncharacterized protein LOC132868983 [Neoarius graeffei]|uniref:uncharacterized protein LOC132868983 n=1 Tax=Neoarius graeffei TaxID=443677 RepID=UPI00298C0A0D|nr:uncharacterized protein LOC132868983 [Neoarius graeffei]
MGESCWLEGNEETKKIAAYTGGSVLLPCSCTDLQTTPETFTWERYTTNAKKWEKISPESEQYKERFQLVNDRSSGNLSLLISHLTEEDGGDYRCSVKGSHYRDIKLTVKGCTLNRQRETVTRYVGQSVLLPCSCSELQAKPHTFTWTFLNGSDSKEIFPKDQTNLYTDRVQLFNDHLPGNLSLLISHLTEEDGGRYRCRIRNRIYRDIHLTVRDAPTKPSSAPVTRRTSSHSKPEHLPYVPFAVVTVFFLHIIVAVVYYTTRKKVALLSELRIDSAPLINLTNQNGELKPPCVLFTCLLFHTETPTNPNPRNIIIIICTAVGVLLLLLLGGVMYWKHRAQRRGQTEIGDGQTGQRTQQKKQNDLDVLYTAINPQTKRKKAEEKDDVTYSTIVHSSPVRAAHTQEASGDTTVYASIKTN